MNTFDSLAQTGHIVFNKKRLKVQGIRHVLGSSALDAKFKLDIHNIGLLSNSYQNF